MNYSASFPAPVKNALSGLETALRTHQPGPGGVRAFLRRMVYTLPLANLILLPAQRRRFLSMLNYIPRPIQAPTVLVRAQRLLNDREQQEAGLKRMLRGPLEVIEASGNHETFLWPAYATRFAPALERALAALLK